MGGDSRTWGLKTNAVLEVTVSFTLSFVWEDCDMDTFQMDSCVRGYYNTILTHVCTGAYANCSPQENFCAFNFHHLINWEKILDQWKFPKSWYACVWSLLIYWSLFLCQTLGCTVIPVLPWNKHLFPETAASGLCSSFKHEQKKLA